MYKRRRRRNNGTWLPVIGTSPATGDRYSHSYLSLTIPSGPAASDFGIIPITFDSPQENQLDPGFETLSEIIGNEYFLKRIVGKIFVDINTVTAVGNLETMAPSMVVNAGFFIARAQDEDVSPGSVLPVGGLNFNQYGPGMLETVREPWIWKRTWILGNYERDLWIRGQLAAGIFQNNAGVSSYPPNNAGYGSIQDGPHIDQKTKRRVRQDERLYFALQGRANGTVPSGGSFGLECFLDIRLFAGLRKAKNSGNF